MSRQNLTIEELNAVVVSRRGGDPAASYTARLFERGVAQCAKKLGEEGVELAIAAVAGDRDAVRGEAADLLYHLVVLLAASGVTLEEVYAELGRREGMSGLTEKANRHT